MIASRGVQLAGYSLLTVIYNLYFHPLHNYPGPVLYRASWLPRALRILRGYWTRDLLVLAEQYGPVVRVAPNVLVYTSADAWKDIYGHQNGAVAKGEEFGKDPKFYRFKNFPPNILGESRENHGLIRRQLSHGFSEKSLRAQEDIIKSYVDLLVKRLKERCVPAPSQKDAPRASEKTAVDMKSWLNYTTFDVIGDLAFGEPFDCLEKGTMDPRVSFLERGLQAGNQTYFLKELGLERFLSLIMTRTASFRRDMIDKTSSVLRRRMELNSERHDLIEGLLSKQEDWVRIMPNVLCWLDLAVLTGNPGHFL